MPIGIFNRFDEFSRQIWLVSLLRYKERASIVIQGNNEQGNFIWSLEKKELPPTQIEKTILNDVTTLPDFLARLGYPKLDSGLHTDYSFHTWKCAADTANKFYDELRYASGDELLTPFVWAANKLKAMGLFSDEMAVRESYGANEELLDGAAQGDCRQIVSSLARGADINTRENRWSHFRTSTYTPLMLATENRRTEAVRLLLARGADVTLKTNSLFGAGKTALDLVQKDSSQFGRFFSKMVSNYPDIRRTQSQEIEELLRSSFPKESPRCGSSPT